MKKHLIILTASIAFVALSALPGVASAQGIKQYQRVFSIGGKLHTTILLVGWTKDAADINKLFDIITKKAGETYARLDCQNPSSEVAKLVATAGQGGTHVSDEVLAAFETAVKVSGWTNGRFDIVSAGNGSWKDIKIDNSSSTIELKKSGMLICFDSIINGFMAEMIARYLYASNMQNVIVKVGNVFRGVGHGLHGPWKIEVQDDAGTFARHALNLTVGDTGVAAVSASQFRGTKTATPCRGVVALMNDAALADGIAHAVFSSGPGEGMKILSKYAKGLIVDNEGKFLRTPGF